MVVVQKTLKTPVELTGVGIHSGKAVSMRVLPAPVHTGLIFKRVDLEPNLVMPATIDLVGDTSFCTTLVKEGVRLSMVEHVLSALAGLGIDNAFIEVNSAEVPIMDGSAYPLVSAILAVGLQEQAEPRVFLKIKESIEIQEGDKWAKVEPFEGFKLSFEVRYTHPAIPSDQQKYTLDLSGSDSYVEELSRARTFGFLSDLEYLRSKNLALGGSLENAVVLDDTHVINPEGLRYANEAVRHKMLDAVGDLRLLGLPILGAFSAYQSGHTLNCSLVRKILAMPQAWEKITLSEALLPEF